MWVPFRKATQPIASIAEAIGRLRKLPLNESVRLLDSAALDDVLLRHATAEGDSGNAIEAYADLKPFSHEDWKRRHGVRG